MSLKRREDFGKKLQKLMKKLENFIKITKNFRADRSKPDEHFNPMSNFTLNALVSEI